MSRGRRENAPPARPLERTHGTVSLFSIAGGVADESRSDATVSTGKDWWKRPSPAPPIPFFLHRNPAKSLSLLNIPFNIIVPSCHV